ncbi:hypothetical protein [Streptomyces mutabilis]|uniref:hypothetical protein n=1 Tax=Streptomyces mutabilis TaxID=67332 RepID=UPI001146215F|nr:hypothetical protein [Streptomyces mutabilis]
MPPPAPAAPRPFFTSRRRPISAATPSWSLSRGIVYDAAHPVFTAAIADIFPDDGVCASVNAWRHLAVKVGAAVAGPLSACSVLHWPCPSRNPYPPRLRSGDPSLTGATTMHRRRPVCSSWGRRPHPTGLSPPRTTTSSSSTTSRRGQLAQLLQDLTVDIAAPVPTTGCMR